MRTAKDACLSGIKGIFPPLSQHPHLAAVGRQSGSQRSRSRQQTAGRRPSYVSVTQTQAGRFSRHSEALRQTIVTCAQMTRKWIKAAIGMGNVAGLRVKTEYTWDDYLRGFPNLCLPR